MGNQASVCSPSDREATKPASIERVCDEAGKLFLMELLEDERHADASTYCTSNSHYQRALQNSNSSSRCNNPQQHTAITLRSILEAASRGSDLGRDEDEDSDSTRDTCDSPLFLPRKSSTNRHRDNRNDPDMKIHPGSLLAHLSFLPSDISRPNRRGISGASNMRQSPSKEVTTGSRIMHQPHQAPIFPDLSSSQTNFSPSTTKTRSKVVKIPRRNKQHYQSEIEEEEHLKRLYDSRTWTMYKRITEARAARQTPAAAAHIGNSSSGAASAPHGQHPLGLCDAHLSSPFLHGPENLAEHQPAAEDEEHDMVFGDLDE